MAGKLKIGVIGLGAIGNVHLNAYPAWSDQAEIAAICDIDEGKLKATGDRLNLKNRFTDYKDMLKTDLDAILVCVWNNLHKEMAINALKSGKHVFLEKPMALNANEGRQIVAAAQAAQKTLQIGMVCRQAAEVQLVRKYVQDGILGNIYHMRAVLIRRRGIPGLGGWFTTKSRSGGGPLIDIAVHWFDAAMYMSGLWQPTSVSAATYAKFGKDMKKYRFVSMWAGPPKLDGICDVEDFATGLVRFGDKATMNFDISWALNSEENTFIEILGDKGGARLFDNKGVKIFTEFNNNVVDIVPQIKEEDRFQKQAQTFIAACRGEAPPAATGREGVTLMTLLDAVYASGEAGKEIKIKQ
jgi:predicted dehydrogenase